jgi:peptidoglycan/LPS O-acetylase OafA/YrhL
MAAKLAEWLPQLEVFLRSYALWAVQVFLVIGGYLTAKSLSASMPQTSAEMWAKLLARYLRLVIPLLAALSVAVAVTALVRPYFDHSSLSQEPTGLQVMAHILLLQDVLRMEAFSAGVWYVAIDFQLFALALIGAWLAHAWHRFSGRGSLIRKALGLWLMLTLSAMFVWNLNPSGDMWGLYFFGAYGLGLCVGAWRQADMKINFTSLALLIMVLGALATAYHPRSRLILAIGTAVLLCCYEAYPIKPIERLKLNWIRQLSSASYAIFLIHFSVSLLVSALVFNVWPENTAINVAGLFVSFALSIWLGRLLYEQVEVPHPTWRRYFQWVGTLIASFTGVILLT